MKRSAAVELFWKVHPWIYRWSGGRLLGRLAGMDVLLLTTTGARSGLARTTALTFFEDDGRYVVVASFLGAPRHPAWLHNLRARPEAQLLIAGRRLDARAHEAAGAERARLFARAAEIQPDYRGYEAHAEREIPVVVLTPRPVARTAATA